MSPATLAPPALPLCPQIPEEAEFPVCCLQIPHQPLILGPIALPGGLHDLRPIEDQHQAEGQVLPTTAPPSVEQNPPLSLK